MRKRNCRKSKEEKQLHEEAVKVRKMTDKQLVAHVKGTYRIGFNDGLKFSKKNLLESVAEVKGIGAVTLARIAKAIEG